MQFRVVRSTYCSLLLPILSFATSVSAQSLTVVNGATYTKEVAPNSFAVAFGSGLSGVNVIRVSVGGRSYDCAQSASPPSCAVTFANDSQVNFIVPGDAPTGAASISAVRGGAVVASGTVTVKSAAPGIFAANQGGRGVAAGLNLSISSANQQRFESLFRMIEGIARPMPVAKREQSHYLVLYGTGGENSVLRSCQGGNIFREALINGVARTPEFYGAAPGFPAVDQMNLNVTSILSQLPEGKEVPVQVRVRGCDGQPALSNTVMFKTNCPYSAPQGTKIGRIRCPGSPEVDHIAWLGAARPDPSNNLPRSPLRGIPVQTNGFTRDDVNCNYRVNLEWIDRAWDQVIAQFRRKYSANALPGPDLLAKVVLNQSIQYISNSVDLGAACYHGLAGSEGGRARVEVVPYYKSQLGGGEISICQTNHLQLEIMKSIGRKLGLSQMVAGYNGRPSPCYGVLGDLYDVDCTPLNGRRIMSSICYADELAGGSDLSRLRPTMQRIAGKKKPTKKSKRSKKKAKRHSAKKRNR